MEEKSMDANLRKELMKKQVTEEELKRLHAQGLSNWEIAEAIYDTKFDRSDKQTWIFFTRVNRLRKKLELPRNLPDGRQVP
jgi:hypothetical protein